MIKTKNIASVSDVATRTDLIKSKETEIKKMSVSMNVTVDDIVNSSKFKKKRNDQWLLKDMNMQNRYEKEMRKFNAYW